MALFASAHLVFGFDKDEALGPECAAVFIEVEDAGLIQCLELKRPDRTDG